MTNEQFEELLNEIRIGFVTLSSATLHGFDNLAECFRKSQHQWTSPHQLVDKAEALMADVRRHYGTIKD